MISVRWERLQEIFLAASELAPEQRTKFLDHQCGADRTLRRQVESLILSDEQAGNFLDQAVDHAAHEVIANASPQEGDRVGPYQIIRLLGRGGMGAVYLASRDDNQFQKQVALKVVRGGFHSAEMLGRFRAERQILANFEHPNIARLLDGGATSDGLPYVVMEYVDGVPLDQYCETHTLPIDDRLELFRTVCSAVQYAHRNLVVHRDIKPANILVTADGTPKLLDFGIAKLLSASEAPEAGLTQAGERLMTPDYASPEQLRGEPVSIASDVYSLGVLLFELLTGSRPFHVATPQMIDPSLFEKDAPLPSSLREGLHSDLDNIVRMALRKEPARRYATVDQFSDDVRRHLDGFPVLARKDTWGYRTGKFVRRHRWGVVAAALFLTLIIGFSVNMGILAERATRERTKAEQVSRFLAGIFRISDPNESRGNKVTAREVLDQGARQIRSELRNAPEVQTEMMQTIGEVYRQLGIYSVARPMLEESLSLRQSHFGREHPDVSRSLASLGTLSAVMGDYRTARAQLEEALAMQRKLLGSRSPLVAGTLAELADVLRQSGDHQSAVARISESLQIRRAVLGSDDVSVAQALTTFGNIDYDMDRFDDAIEHQRQAAAIFRARRGDDHPQTAEAISSLAAAMLAKADYPAAEANYAKALAIYRKALGDNHVEVARVFNDLGVLYTRRGQYQQAEQSHRRALETYRQALGEEHPFVASSMTNLASTLHQLGNHAEEGKLAELALIMRRKLAPDELHSISNSLIRLGVSREENGDRTGAERALREALELRTRAFPPNSPSLAIVRLNLGMLLAAKGDRLESEKFLRSAVETYRSLGSQHPYTAQSLNGLARILLQQGRTADAEALYQEALAFCRRKQQPSHSDFATALIGLADIRVSQGKDSEAEALLREAWEAKGLQPLLHAKAGVSLISLLASRGRLPQASALLASVARDLKPLPASRETNSLRARLSALIGVPGPNR